MNTRWSLSFSCGGRGFLIGKSESEGFWKGSTAIGMRLCARDRSLTSAQLSLRGVLLSWENVNPATDSLWRESNRTHSWHKNASVSIELTDLKLLTYICLSLLIHTDFYKCHVYDLKEIVWWKHFVPFLVNSMHSKTPSNKSSLSLSLF